jgi:hypothetical protein
MMCYNGHDISCKGGKVPIQLSLLEKNWTIQ